METAYNGLIGFSLDKWGDIADDSNNWTRSCQHYAEEIFDDAAVLTVWQKNAKGGHHIFGVYKLEELVARPSITQYAQREPIRWATCTRFGTMASRGVTPAVPDPAKGSKIMPQAPRKAACCTLGPWRCACIRGPLPFGECPLSQ